MRKWRAAPLQAGDDPRPAGGTSPPSPKESWRPAEAASGWLTVRSTFRRTPAPASQRLAPAAAPAASGTAPADARKGYRCRTFPALIAACCGWRAGLSGRRVARLRIDVVATSPSRAIAPPQRSVSSCSTGAPPPDPVWRYRHTAPRRAHGKSRWAYSSGPACGGRLMVNERGRSCNRFCPTGWCRGPVFPARRSPAS